MQSIKKIVLAIVLLLILSVSGGLFVGCSISADKYMGKTSYNFNGNTFVNMDSISSKGFWGILKVALTEERGSWKKMPIDETLPLPPKYAENGEVKVTFINHSTFLIQVNGINIITDPIWSKRTSPFSWIGPSRYVEPGITFDQLPKVDVILISHNHYDHMDIPTLRRIVERDKPRIFAPLGNSAFLTKNDISGSEDFDWWDEINVKDDISIACVPAQHFSGRGLDDRNKTLWSGWMVKTPYGNIYFAGDTGYGSFVHEISNRFQPIITSIIPIGAYKPRWFMHPVHVDPQQAAQMHIDLQSQQSIGCHFGTFNMAWEGMYEPVEELAQALDSLNIPKNDFLVLKQGAMYEKVFDQNVLADK